MPDASWRAFFNKQRPECVESIAQTQKGDHRSDCKNNCGLSFH